MFCLIILTGIILNPTLSARLSTNARPPNDSSSTYFSAVFYTRKPSSIDTQYFLVRVRCGAVLISPKWVLTSSNCHLKLTWNILIGVRTIPRHGIYSKNTYKIKRTINSLESLLILVEMDRRIEIDTVKIAKIGEFIQRNESCIVASWILEGKDSRGEVKKKLHCTFDPQNSSLCLDYVKERQLNMTMTDTDICLLQRNDTDRVKLCAFDIGAPFVCNGLLVGLVYFIPIINKTKSSDCAPNKNPAIPRLDDTDKFYPVTAIYPEIDWVLFFIADPKSSCSNLYLNVYLYFIVVKFIIS